MEIKSVKLAGDVSQKSNAEIEEKLIEGKGKPTTNPGDELSGVTSGNTVDEKSVIDFIKGKYNKDFSSIEDLLKPVEVKVEVEKELPEDIKSFIDYRNKTGRGLEDYVKLGRDVSSLSEEQLLKEYFLSTGDAIDDEDVDVLMHEYKNIDDLEDEIDVARKKLEKKKILSKAKKYFDEQKEMYRKPLESRVEPISEEDKKALEDYRQYISDSSNEKAAIEKARDWFVSKTDEVFNNFEGFDFNVGDDKVLKFNPGKADDLKSSQLDSSNLFSKYLDDDGLLKDAFGYHRALAVAMNPEKFAAYFYEQGKSDGVDGVNRKIKNIDMSTRQTSQVYSKDGLKVRAVNSNNDGNRMVIKSRK